VTGQIVQSVWESLSERLPSIELDSWVIMPNHVHGIVFLREPGDHEKAITLGGVVRVFKSVATAQARKSVDPTFGWQPNYYEHVVRSDQDLQRVREYVRDNPIKWHLDENNQVNW
jgi:putative transposase